jgi:hypothetical protein
MGQPGFEGFLFAHVLNGTIAAQGEEAGDRWDLVVTGNVVSRVDYDLVPRESGRDHAVRPDEIVTRETTTSVRIRF